MLSHLMDINTEMNRGEAKFGPYNSLHEAVAVIREEYLELERAVFWGGGDIQTEALQLAAVSTRLYRDLGLAKFTFPVQHFNEYGDH